MTFFYDLNKRLANLASQQDAKQLAEDVKATAPKSQLAESMAVAEAGYSAKKAAAGKDIGKPGKNFAKIEKSAAKKYGSKEAGARVAGAVLNKLRHPKESCGMADEGNAFTGALAKTPKGDKFKVGNKEFTDTSSLEEVGMTPKQKKFAKLAPPADKITFADKIAGAKKEVDEMLGDVAADAMRKAVGGHGEEVDEGFAEMDAWLKSREKEKGTGRFDKRKVSTGTVYTRKPETFDEPETAQDAGPKKKGRPKGPAKGPERVTGKAWKHKGGRAEKTAEDLDTDGVMMTRPSNMSSESAGDNKGAIKAAVALLKKAGYKIMKKAEESTDTKDTHAEKAGKKVTKDIEYDEKKKDGIHGKKRDSEDSKAEKAGKKVAKDIEHDEKVDETTDAPKAKKGGYNFGGGVYEGFNNKVETMISEGIEVVANESMDGGEEKITVVATGPEVHALKELLKMAGLTAQADATCDSCGCSPCGCEEEQVDENSPDWPTNTEKSDDALQYSGGLNGPKSTGQSTVPVLASQGRRQVSMEENVDLERSLFKLYKDISGK